MPEGPEIRRLRDRLAKALQGRVASRVHFHLPNLTDWNGRLDDRQILDVESRGKALLIHFDGSLSLYTHNQLYGRWVLATPGERPATRRSLRLEIHTDRVDALLYSASTIEPWPTTELHRHPFLQRLGPDLLDPATEINLVLDRLEVKPFCNRRLGHLLTDQSFLAGLGNYLRCEILFAAGLRPHHKPNTLDDKTLANLARIMVELPRRAYQTGGITRDPKVARTELANGADFETVRFNVYRRGGLPCHRCATPVIRSRDAGQVFYFCPSCQC